MREIGPIFKKVPRGGEQYISVARTFLGKLKQRKEALGLLQAQDTFELADGTKIFVQILPDGKEIVRIEPVGGEEEESVSERWAYLVWPRSEQTYTIDESNPVKAIIGKVGSNKVPSWEVTTPEKILLPKCPEYGSVDWRNKDESIILSWDGAASRYFYEGGLGVIPNNLSERAYKKQFVYSSNVADNYARAVYVYDKNSYKIHMSSKIYQNGVVKAEIDTSLYVMGAAVVLLEGVQWLLVVARNTVQGSSFLKVLAAQFTNTLITNFIEIHHEDLKSINIQDPILPFLFSPDGTKGVIKLIQIMDSGYYGFRGFLEVIGLSKVTKLPEVSMSITAYPTGILSLNANYSATSDVCNCLSPQEGGTVTISDQEAHDIRNDFVESYLAEDFDLNGNLIKLFFKYEYTALSDRKAYGLKDTTCEQQNYPSCVVNPNWVQESTFNSSGFFSLGYEINGEKTYIIQNQIYSNLDSFNDLHYGPQVLEDLHEGTIIRNNMITFTHLYWADLRYKCLLYRITIEKETAHVEYSGYKDQVAGYGSYITEEKVYLYFDRRNIPIESKSHTDVSVYKIPGAYDIAEETSYSTPTYWPSSMITSQYYGGGYDHPYGNANKYSVCFSAIDLSDWAPISYYINYITNDILERLIYVSGQTPQYGPIGYINIKR